MLEIFYLRKHLLCHLDQVSGVFQRTCPAKIDTHQTQYTRTELNVFRKGDILLTSELGIQILPTYKIPESNSIGNYTYYTLSPNEMNPNLSDPITSNIAKILYNKILFHRSVCIYRFWRSADSAGPLIRYYRIPRVTLYNNYYCYCQKMSSYRFFL